MFGAPKPNPKKAYKELKTNALLFGTMLVAVRTLPYLLHLHQKATASSS